MSLLLPDHPATSTGEGPYISEHDPDVYLPVDRWSFNEARTEAARYAEDAIGPWGRSRYVGKERGWCHDHEDWEACGDPDYDCRCCERMVWHFETYEGTYRG